MKLEIKEGKDLLSLAPSTRYQGSKRKVLPWLHDNLKHLEFETVLDGFGGTASVSYMLKLMGKSVTFNDVLLSNYQTGVALIENDDVKLNKADLDFLLHRNGFNYPSFIQDTFQDIYYLDGENRFLDMLAFNIKMLCRLYSGNTLKKKRALAYHALFQACLCKRPFNLFHRKNLYLRTANVERSFGNKTTWNTDFSTLFTRFNSESSEKVFSNSKTNRATCEDIFEVENQGFDLVYLDPPYARVNVHHPQDYHELYHFLEGISDYENWPDKIDLSRVNKCMLKKGSGWGENSLEENFKRLFEKFRNSIIVVSYGHPGDPPIRKIEKILKCYKSEISIAKREYIYRLNHNNRHGLYEVLMIGQ